MTEPLRRLNPFPDEAPELYAPAPALRRLNPFPDEEAERAPTSPIVTSPFAEAVADRYMTNTLPAVAGKLAEMAEAAEFAARQDASMQASDAAEKKAREPVLLRPPLTGLVGMIPAVRNSEMLQELDDALVRGTGGIVGAAGGMLEREASAIPRRMAALAGASGALPLPLAVRAAETAPTIQPLAKAGKALQEVPGAVQQATPRPEYAQDFWRGMKTDPAKTLAVSAAENLPNLVAVIGASAVNPALGLGTAYSLEAGSAYQEAKESGATEAQAQAISGWVGLGNMALEYSLAGRLLKRLPGAPAAKRALMAEMLKASATEGGAETLQEANQIIAQAITTGEWPTFLDFAKRTLESGVVGGVLGGGAGSISGVTDQPATESAAPPIAAPADERRLDIALRQEVQEAMDRVQAAAEQSNDRATAIAVERLAQERLAGTIHQTPEQAAAAAGAAPKASRRSNLPEAVAPSMAPEEVSHGLRTEGGYGPPGISSRRDGSEEQIVFRSSEGRPVGRATLSNATTDAPLIEYFAVEPGNSLLSARAALELGRELGRRGARLGAEGTVTPGAWRLLSRVANSPELGRFPEIEGLVARIREDHPALFQAGPLDDLAFEPVSAPDSLPPNVRQGVPSANEPTPDAYSPTQGEGIGPQIASQPISGGAQEPAAFTPMVPPPWQEKEVPRETSQAEEAQAPKAAPVLSGNISSTKAQEAQVDKGQKPAPPQRAPIVVGSHDAAVSERGRRIEFDYAVADARDLITSNDDSLRPNLAYPQEIQPRDRTRATSEAQVSRIQKGLNPELLAASPRISDGAPIIGDDRVVESGNARTIGIRRAYKDGGEVAERYSNWVHDHAEQFGLDPASLATVEQPVLVRVRRTPVDRAKFAREANEGTEASGDPRQASLLGPSGPPDRLDLIREAIRTRESAGQGDLFAPPIQAGAGEAGFIGKGAAGPASPTGPRFSRPEAEAEFQQARKGVEPEGTLDRIRDGVADLYRRWTRVHRRIPHGRRFARFQESLRLLEHQPDVAADWVEQRLGPALRSLDDSQRELFDRKLLVDNLDGILTTYGPGTEIPFLDPSEVSTEKATVDAAVANDARVQAAVAAHRASFAEARTELAAAYDAIGMDPAPLFKQGDTYLHHQVLEYADPSRGVGSRLKKPVGRGWQKTLRGSKLPFNLHYLQAQGRVLAEMRVATVMAQELAKLEKNYDIAPQVRKEARDQGVEDWTQLIPDGYDIWQPQRGSALFPAHRIAEDVATKILQDGVAEVTSDDLAKGLVLGAKRKQLVLPTEIVETLNELNNPTPPSTMSNLSRAVMAGFKKASLFFPRRVVKYLFRNYVGDTQSLTRSNPKALRRLGQAASELRTFLGDGKMPSREFESWHLRGGLTANLRSQELNSSEKARLARLARSGSRLDWRSIGQSLLADPVRAARQVWRRTLAGGRATRAYLESLNRYASYLEYLNQIRQSSEGRPENFGASIPEEVMELETPEDRAYWLSNQSLGAYDQVTELGRMLRTHAVPFYSFQELAVRSNYRLLRNELAASPEAHLGYAIKVFGRQAVKRAPFMALKAGKFLALAYAFEALMATWNRLLFDDEDDELPDEVQRQAHITFGKTPDGNVLAFTRLSVFEEVRDWFGIDEFGSALMDYLDGRATAGEVAQRMLLQPIDKAVGAITPVGLKGVGELLTGKSTFPHATRPSEIEDRAEYLARMVASEKEYRYLAGKPDPSRTYLRSLLGAIVYEYEPGAAAYFDSLTYRRQYLRSTGRDDEGYSTGAKTIALRNYKRAIRYGQMEIALKYLGEYVALGGKESGIAKSLDRMDPLFGVKDESAFRNWLHADERVKLDRAVQYYQSVLAASDTFLSTPAARAVLSAGTP